MSMLTDPEPKIYPTTFNDDKNVEPVDIILEPVTNETVKFVYQIKWLMLHLYCSYSTCADVENKFK
jgi:hypothetical protein